VKKVNFANALPEKKYRELRLWMITTGILLGTGICAVIGINLAQLPDLWHVTALRNDLRAQFAAAQDIKPADTELKKEHEMLCKRVDKVKRRQTHRKDPLPLLRIILGSRSKPIKVERFHIGNNTIELTAATADPKYVTQLAEQIGKLGMVEQIEVTTIHRNETARDNQLAFNCTIKGRLKRKKKEA